MTSQITGERTSSQEPAQTHAARGRRRRLLTTAALLLSLLGALWLLTLVFQPFANAAGGCGGG